MMPMLRLKRERKKSMFRLESSGKLREMSSKLSMLENSRIVKITLTESSLSMRIDLNN